MTAPSVTAADTQLRAVAAQLADAGVAAPDWDARWLVRHAAATGSDLDDLVRRRVAREPLQHILGTAAFRHLELEVGPGVFVPRPETELLVDAALAHLRPLPRARVVDLCAGSGALGLSVAHERDRAGGSCEVYLVESEPAAVGWLRRNVARVRSAVDPATVVMVCPVDLARTPAELDGSIDLVVANPPYLPLSAAPLLDRETAEHDPPTALWGGPDGLAVIREVITTAARLLRTGGVLVVEHDSDHHLAELLAAGWADVERHRDLTGRWRYTTARRVP